MEILRQCNDLTIELVNNLYGLVGSNFVVERKNIL